MTLVLPKPIRESDDAVTLRRADWEALIERLEDAADLAAVHARRAREAAEGTRNVRRNYLTGGELRRLLDFESPVKVWREKRGLSQRELASSADVSPSYLAEIETHRKPGSAEVLSKLAGVLAIPMEHLVFVQNRLHIAFHQLTELAGAGFSEIETISEAGNVIATLKERGADPGFLSELRYALISEAARWANAGMNHEDRALSCIVEHCLG